MADYPFECLIMDLLEREDTFERLLTHEHVKDRLINKQIVPYTDIMSLLWQREKSIRL